MGKEKKLAIEFVLNLVFDLIKLYGKSHLNADENHNNNNYYYCLEKWWMASRRVFSLENKKKL